MIYIAYQDILRSLKVLEWHIKTDKIHSLSQLGRNLDNLIKEIELWYTVGALNTTEKAKLYLKMNQLYQLFEDKT